MPSPATVSIRKYNKELKVSADIRAELEASQEKLKTARKKNRDLKQQLKVAVADGQDFAAWQEDLSLEKTKNIQLSKRLKALSDQDQELANCRKSLQTEKAKNSVLKQRLKDVSAPGEQELNAVRNQCRAKHKAAFDELVLAHETQFKKLQSGLGDRVKELESINKKLMLDTEHLRLKLNGNVKIQGNLERINKDPRVTKHPHLISGGRAGSV